MAVTPGRNDAEWLRLSKRLKRELAPICWICGEEIDLSLPGGKHPMSWSLDHVKELSEHPELALEESNLRPAHMVHNSSRRGGGSRVRKISGSWG